MTQSVPLVYIQILHLYTKFVLTAVEKANRAATNVVYEKAPLERCSMHHHVALQRVQWMVHQMRRQRGKTADTKRRHLAQRLPAGRCLVKLILHSCVQHRFALFI